jgi:predicted site-specific integrase-resolvase
MPETALSGWLSPKGAADRLGVTPQRVVQLARAGEIENILTPLGRLIDPEAVERLAAERETRRRGRRETPA